PATKASDPIPSTTCTQQRRRAFCCLNRPPRAVSLPSGRDPSTDGQIHRRRLRLRILRVFVIANFFLLHSALLQHNFLHRVSADELSATNVATRVPPSAMFRSRQGVEIEILEVRLRSLSLDAIQGQVELQVRVRNNSETPARISSDQFHLQCNRIPSTQNPAVVNPIPTEEALAVDGVSEGALAFSLISADPHEPALELTWKSGDDAAEISLNKVIRLLSGQTVLKMGPDNCLAVIETHRPLDNMEIWLLSETLVKLSRSELQRVVLDIRAADSETSGYSPTANALLAWLSTARKDFDVRQMPVQIRNRCPVQFDEFHVSGFNPASSRRIYFRTSSAFLHVGRDAAISAAMQSVYDDADLESVVADFHHPENGIRMVAIEGGIDRLPPNQLESIVSGAIRDHSSSLPTLANNLHRVPYAGSVPLLDVLVRSREPAVSTGAIHSMVRSIAPGADELLRRTWQNEARQNPALREAIVREILQARNHRCVQMISEFADDQLRQYCLNDSEPAETEAESLPPNGEAETPKADEKELLPGDDSITSTSSTRRPTVDSTLLRHMLSFLKSEDQAIFTDVAGTYLLKISDPQIQDQVLGFVIDSNPAASQLAKAYIAQRLPSQTEVEDELPEHRKEVLRQRFAPRGVAANPGITATLLNTIEQFPDHSYGASLLRISRSTGLSSTLKGEAFRIGLTCQSDTAFEELLNNFDQHDQSQQVHLLKRAAGLHHPTWLSLCRKCLDPGSATQNEALRLLQLDGSIEATEVLLEYAETLKQQIEEQNTMDGQLERVMNIVLMQLATSLYPEARRWINRCALSHVQKLAESAQTKSILAHGRNPHRRQAYEAYKLGKEQNYEEALKVYSDILQKDPFYDTVYVSRASLYLRSGDIDKASPDMEMADRLNPEDPINQSLIALTLVRSGKIEQGIELGERILSIVPDLQTDLRKWTIYNTACIYGRVAEMTTDDAEREQHLQRGFALLQESIQRESGVDDPDHVLRDPDLNSFHKHPGWERLLQIVRANAEKKPKP
ncbi:MAG: tetratricopeptide repeat protein, partial [Planctomycetaceae bacterium]|nr:tetratricopeptide repeat protein [Planctomycetaceae bacterium]